VRIIARQIEKNINTVQTSSLGRLFDAVTGMAGLGSVNSFDAQLPMYLEARADEDIDESYDFDITESDDMLIFEPDEMLSQLIKDIRKDEKISLISSRFHNCIARGMASMAVKTREKTSLNTAALSGGVFCNQYLLSKLIKLLKKNGFSVLFNRRVPSNDGGIALGQAAAAVRKSNLKYRNK
jgi:hydrogenase maturation protein HypF